MRRSEARGRSRCPARRRAPCGCRSRSGAGSRCTTSRRRGRGPPAAARARRRTPTATRSAVPAARRGRCLRRAFAVDTTISLCTPSIGCHHRLARRPWRPGRLDRQSDARPNPVLLCEWRVHGRPAAASRSARYFASATSPTISTGLSCWRSADQRSSATVRPIGFSPAKNFFANASLTMMTPGVLLAIRGREVAARQAAACPAS